MSDAETRTANQPNLVEKMHELRDAYLQTWSKYLIEEVNSESYAQASGAALNSYLKAAAPLKEPADQAMLRTLQQLHMPSSADFAGLAGRFTNIEMQLDNMDAKLDRMEERFTRLQAVAPAAARRPVEVESKAQAAPARQAARKTAEAGSRAAAPKRRSTVRAARPAKRAAPAKAVRRDSSKGGK
jgi:hypothetical protein